MRNITKEYIPFDDMISNALLKHFSVPPQGSKKNDDLCNRLLKNIIYSKIGVDENEKYINIGKKQGLNIISDDRAVYESKERYPEVLHLIIPESILRRERARTFPKDYSKYFNLCFGRSVFLKLLYLLRIASYTTPLLHMLGVEFNQILVISPSESVPSPIVKAFFKNDSFTSNSVNTLGGETEELEKAIYQVNGVILLVEDETKADKPKQCEEKIRVLEKATVSQSSDNSFIPVIISKYAASEIRHDLCCSVTISDFSYNLEANYIKKFLGFNDAEYITRIEKIKEFKKINNDNFTDVSLNIPGSIPPHRRSVYVILMTALRSYNSFFNYFFDENVEQYVIDWLSDYNEDRACVNDVILKDFGICLNQEISTGRFNYIKRRKYIVFDKETNSVIVDDENIYIETAVIRELVKINMKGLRCADSLTDILKANDYLEINDKNSKCYRFRVQNSEGEPYMLYTYGISKELINAENHKKFELADMEPFLLEYAEMENNAILPLGIATDGRYVGKDICYQNKSNDSIFITGQSGKGKTFYASNLLPFIVMPGSRMAVFDVSGLFTHEELLRALPEDVVDALFDFVDVGVGKRKMPINLLYIGDCEGLP